MFNLYSEKKHLQTSPDHQIIALIWNIGFTESNDGLRTLVAHRDFHFYITYRLYAYLLLY